MSEPNRAPRRRPDRLPAGGLVTTDLIAAAIARACAVGALTTITTDHRRIVDGAMPFVIRRVSSLAAKAALRAPAARSGNPFLPYDPALEVTGLGDDHVCLLNKFNVVPGHVLIVTRAFAAQEALIGEGDFAALWRVLGGIDGLGFYNAGPAAGASQPHKHLQVVPLPLAPADRPDDPPVPLQALIDAAGGPPTGHIGRLPQLPFRHAFLRLDPERTADPAAAAAVSLDRYRAMLAALGIAPPPGSDRSRRPYNLLLTRTWMVLVPRARESVAGISINALGFAGSLFVRDRDQLATIERHGPMAMLAAVAEPGRPDDPGR